MTKKCAFNLLNEHRVALDHPPLILSNNPHSQVALGQVFDPLRELERVERYAEEGLDAWDKDTPFPVRVGDIVYKHFCGGTTIGRVARISRRSVTIQSRPDGNFQMQPLAKFEWLTPSQAKTPYFKKLLKAKGLTYTSHA